MYAQQAFRALTIAVVAAGPTLLLHSEPANAKCLQGRPGRAVNTLNCPCNYRVPGSARWWEDCNAKLGLGCWEVYPGSGTGICRPPPYSDVRLKKDIVPLGKLANGIGVYRFRYKGNDEAVYVGVMAQEVRNLVPSAVLRGRDGYLRVDYDRLGMKFMTWNEWIARNSARSRTLQ